MRARDIKPGFYKSDQLAECSMTARLLFPGLWMLADREGRLENRPRKIKAEIFPFDDVDVAPLLVELENAGLIRTYEANGTALIWIPQFKRHQSPHKNEKNSELAAHPDDLSATCPVQEQAKDRTTPEKEGTAPVISGQIPLTPSSLTPSSLSPRDNTPLTPHGGDAFGDAGDSPLAGQTGSPDGGKPRAQRKRFIPPTVEEVADYCRERQNGIDPEAFVDFYMAKGWLVGKSPMKDWRSAVRTWEHERRSQSRPAYQMPIN